MWASFLLQSMHLWTLFELPALGTEKRIKEEDKSSNGYFNCKLVMQEKEKRNQAWLYEMM